MDFNFLKNKKLTSKIVLFFIPFLGEYSPEIVFDSALNLEDKGAKPKTSEVK